MRWSPLLLVAGLSSTALSSPVQPKTTHALKESHPVPRGWRRTSRARPADSINLQIGLKQGDFDGLERSLYEGKYQ